MNFIDTLKSSIYDPEFYASLPQTPLKKSFGYYSKLALLFIIIGTAFFSVVLLPQLTRFLSDENLNRLISHFPEGLEVKIERGVVSTNLPGAHFIDIPSEFSSDMTHFIVIDTETPITIDEFEKQRSLIWIGRDKILFRDKNKITVESVSDIPDITVSREKIRSLLNTIKPIFKFIPFLALVGIFLFLFVAYGINLIYLLFMALIVLVIGKIKGISLSYKNGYQTGLHAMSLALVVDFFFAIIPGFAGTIPFLFSAITVLTAVFNLKKKDPAQAETQNSPPLS